jgi:hypothetical protein
VSPSHISLSPFSAASVSDAACRVLQLLAPSASSASRPPGFEASPSLGTPPLVVEGAIPRTPRHGVHGEEATPLQPLFRAAMQALLSPPSSTPPRRAVARRRTLAGVDIKRTVTYSIQRRSSRMRAAKPVAKAAEAFLCKGLGIIDDGQEVTELVLQELERRFDGQIPDDVLGSLRTLFNVDSQEADDVDAALLGHGGVAGLDHVVTGVDVDDDA